MLQRNRLAVDSNHFHLTPGNDLLPPMCCEEHRQQLEKFTGLSQLLPSVDLNSLAFYFARNCKNNRKAARAIRRRTALAPRSPLPDEKSNSPFYVVDRLLAAPDSLYAPELTSHSFRPLCSRQDLRSSFEKYVKTLSLEDCTIMPYAFDVQLKYRSLSFLTREQRAARLKSMKQIHLRETKINRVHQGTAIELKFVVDPFITPRAIQSLVEDKNGELIRLSTYNWHTILADQSIPQTRNRFRTGKSCLIGNPFIKMGADGILMIRVDNPRLEMLFLNYENEIESMSADELREMGNKCFRNNDVYGAIEYYTLGLAKSPDDTRILSNRAECYLQGELPHLALADCQRIFELSRLHPTEENSDTTMTWKIYYRQMRALIGLQRYEEAKSSIHPLLPGQDELGATRSEIIDRFRRIIEIDIPRLQNEANGQYNMIEFLNERATRNDEFPAEYERSGAYEFRPCDQPSKGFGLFALEPLEPGTLLLVEEPFAYAHAKTNEYLVDNPLHVIFFGITQKRDQRREREGSNQVPTRGKYLRQSTLELFNTIETRILIDPKHAIKRLSHLMPLRQHLQRQRSIDDDENYEELPYKAFYELCERNVIGTGLWPKLARFNHSCLPNCCFLVIRHLCFVSVLKPIAVGEELTICYLPSVYHSYVDRTLRLRNFYIDHCDCSLCDYDQTTGQGDMHQLCRLFEETEDDEEKRRYIFKHLLWQYGQTRPLGFVEQMSLLKRPVSVEIFLDQVKHGYLGHAWILNYLLTHMRKYSKLKSVFQELEREFAYFQWHITNDQTSDDEQKEKWTEMIRLLIETLPS